MTIVLLPNDIFNSTVDTSFKNDFASFVLEKLYVVFGCCFGKCRFLKIQSFDWCFVASAPQWNHGNSKGAALCQPPHNK